MKPTTTTTTATAAPTRRDFVKTSTVAAVAAAAASTMIIPQGVFADADNKIKIGLVGVGGRGSGAARNAVNSDPGVVLHALGDLFEDQISDPKVGHVDPLKTELGAQMDVPKARQFVGWDAYKGVIDCCDVVLLATPPHFRPMHLEAVANAGKHCFCEKPVGVDPVGVKKVMEISKIFAEKKKSLVSGLCYRYDEAKKAIVAKIHDGAIGDIRTLQHNYLTGGLWTRPRQDSWTDMDFQIRNWLYFYWLSGDHIVEQHIHSLDKMMWIMKDEPPVKVIATGGRVQRTAPQYGNVYDHFNTIFEWENGVRAFTNCRQFTECSTDVSDYAFGTEGIASVGNEKPFITGKNPVKIKKSAQNMYDSEHVALFKSIRNNEPINNGDYMCKSTMVAIMARTSAYSGKEVTWQQMMDSKESFTPDKYAWGPRVVDPVVIPGQPNPGVAGRGAAASAVKP
jgi:predicted dehydrogenase